MAFPNDMSRIVESVAGAAASDATFTNASSKSARNLIRRTAKLYKPAADGAAGTATVYTTGDVHRHHNANRLMGAFFVPTVAVTADASNNATINIVKADGLGGAPTVVASLITNLAQGNLVAGVAYPLLVVTADPTVARLALGQIYGITISKGGTGVVIPIGSFLLDVEEEDIDGYSV